MSSNTKNTMFIVSTSHMDLDWQYTFDEYYEDGPKTSDPNSGDLPVKNILADAINLMQAIPASGIPAYQYNLAEVAWLARYIEDYPDTPATLATLKGQMYFLGGGISSPDNLVCNGETFIRNYLVGRTFIKKAGLGHLLSDVCWIPDDFGSDPQLPVVLKAMGMKGVSFARVPGEQPQTNNNPKTAYLPLDGSPAMNAQLKSDGVTFIWKAADESTSLAVYMSDIPQSPGYGVIWNQPKSDTDTLVEFVSGSTSADDPTARNVNFPGNLLMAPCGGDFSTPASQLTQTVADFNQNNGQGTGIQAVMGTFEDYITAIEERAENDPFLLKTYTNFDPSNYWTGHFASRVQLKIDQQTAANNLMAAETLVTLLRLMSSASSSAYEAIEKDIAEAWSRMAFSTHHDFINGTSVNNVYNTEQLDMLHKARAGAAAALKQGARLLGESVKSEAASTEIPYVVFNSCGFARTSSCLAEIPTAQNLEQVQSYRRMNSQKRWPIQRRQDGSLLIRLCDIVSTSYECVYLSTLPPTETIANPVSVQTDKNFPGIYFNFSNANLRCTVDGHNNWAILSMVALDSNTELFPGTGNFGNLVQVYSETFNSSLVGNLYQMGNEFNNAQEGQLLSDPQAVKGFSLDASASTFTSTEAKILENGPYRASFIGLMENSNGLQVEVQYTLDYDAKQLDISVTGDAGGTENSVVTAWDLAGTGDISAAYMSYGTGNHWNTSQTYTPYWYGPTFRPVHDYLSVVNSDGSASVCLYNEGMRSWAFYNNQVMGILFRNASGGGRGASGSDTSRHTQRFAFRIPGAGDASTCGPLKESMAFQQSLVVAPVTGTSAAMPETGMLAWSDDEHVIIRLARTIEQSTDASLSFVLRCYQPTNNTGNSSDIYVPRLNGQNAGVSLVTALEEEIPDAPSLELDKGRITVPDMPTLATLRIDVQ